MAQQEQYGQIANYNISPGTRGNGQSSALEVTSLGTLLVTPGSEGFPVTGGGGTQYTQGGATVANPTGNSLIYFDSGNNPKAVTSTQPLPETLATLLAGEDLSGTGGIANQVMGTIQKPVVTTSYSPLINSSFGTATKANAKASAGQMLFAAASNANASVRYFQIHNKASNPAGTDVPLFSIPVSAGTTNAPGQVILDNDFFTQNGFALSTGVSWAISTTVATFTDSATASDHVINIGYI